MKARILPMVAIGLLLLVLLSGCSSSAKDLSPEILEFSVYPQEALAGEPVSVHMEAEDDRSLKGIALSVNGIRFAYNCDRGKECERSWNAVPADLGIGHGTLTLSLLVVDMAGNETYDEKTIAINLVTKTCADLAGNICSSDEFCDSEWLYANDSDRCCSIQCRPIVQLVPERTCGEQLGYVCSLEEYCLSGWLNASDALRCCSTECRTDEPLEGICRTMGGQACALGESCQGSWLDASDVFKCCSGQCVEIQPKEGCREMSGFICSVGESCGGGLLDVSDTARCCSQQCDAPVEPPLIEPPREPPIEPPVEPPAGDDLRDRLRDSLGGFGGLVEDPFGGEEDSDLISPEVPQLGGGGLS